ncbi:MAG: UDP-3-O-acyl-N-acetylglucosamine deacetylase [Myxococcales bacterium]|nr:UDP-3-O-acyl-N-acetylglucosamine deacetylase [Myxococcales bacterium]MDH5306528.1 UDP-3-O-acyl-N-acetylglucosamine deacetylase [Myxococcales bacterium]MDH5567328.1 UDP-3-O-acyl-N-acetylglucosamine deacetylase [Myxococcales bacterium]
MGEVPLYQQTIAEKVSCTGIGLHSGAPAQLSLFPARANTGMVFVRTDRGVPVEIPARASEVASTDFATTLGRNAACVGTVEHLLAALYGLEIDNVRIEIDGPELPVMDGSAAPFVYLIRSAGIFTQSEPRSVLRVRRKLEVVDGDRRISIEPARDLRISYAVDFAHPAIRRQELQIDRMEPEIFERDISAARTFGFLNEVHALWNAGFALGGGLENAVLLDDEKVINPDGLRWEDEFVRHKVLDFFGDLALVGMPVQGHVRVERGGHALHQKLVAAILANSDAWDVVQAGKQGARGIRLARVAAAARF